MVMVLMAVFWIFCIETAPMAHARSRENDVSIDEEINSGPLPGLSDIIPMAAQLSGRFETLEKRIDNLSLDASEFEIKLVAIEERLRRLADQLVQVKAWEINKLKKLVSIREAVEIEKDRLAGIGSPLKNNIRQFGMLRKEWSTEKTHWHEWRSAIMQEGVFDQLQPVFIKTDETIDRALHHILQQLKTMLKMQENAGRIETTLFTMQDEIASQIMNRRRMGLAGRSFPLLSPRFFGQFNGALWHELKAGMDSIDWPNSRFFARMGWILVLHALFSIILFAAIWRNRETAKTESYRQFVSSRPLSVALFAGCMATLALYETVGNSDVWRLFLFTVSLASMCRLVGSVSKSPEGTQFVYGLVSVIIVTQFMQVIHLPLPLLRLYLSSTAIVGVAFCIYCARKSDQRKLSSYSRSFRLFALFLSFIIVAELIGRTKLALYLLISFITTVGVLISYAIFRHLIRGTVEWVLSASFFRGAEGLFKRTNRIIRQTTIVVDIILWGFFFIPTILVIWKVYDSFGLAIKGYLSLGVEMGSQRISLGLVITASAILYVTFFVSWVLQQTVLTQLLSTRQVEIGVRHAIERLVHYLIVFMGILFTLSVLGLDFTKLTILLSALGVGIGFGLQGIVNNFVSGIILLFERPVRVHDMVEIDGQWAVIGRIGLRSTTVTTFSGSDLVIPNANLVNNEVTNWTLSNRRARIDVPVGVAYGSNVAKVIDLLTACGKNNPWVAPVPEPIALFLHFGESALEFELRVWVYDAENRLMAQSEIHQEIDQKFREEEIEIAFPQRDLHLRGIDASSAAFNHSSGARSTS
ncbi:hypothetical protein JCM12296A_10410 [Desulfosarcina cetonica]